MTGKEFRTRINDSVASSSISRRPPMKSNLSSKRMKKTGITDLLILTDSEEEGAGK